MRLTASWAVPEQGNASLLIAYIVCVVTSRWPADSVPGQDGHRTACDAAGAQLRYPDGVAVTALQRHDGHGDACRWI